MVILMTYKIKHKKIINQKKIIPELADFFKINNFFNKT